MPRDGLGIFTAAAPDVVTLTTIDSGVHNGLVHDFVIDANAKRPIIAGGTAASSAKEARTNLGAEVAGAEITNYDSHVFENGSFYSAIAATGAPNATDYFVGFAVILTPPNVSLVLEARSISSGVPYVRIKTGGTWGPWAVDGEGAYVNVVGDTMTGHLGLPVGPAAHQAVRKDYVDAGDSAVAAAAAGAAGAAQGTANTALSNAATAQAAADAANANANNRLLRTTDTFTGTLTVAGAINTNNITSFGGATVTGNLAVYNSVSAINFDASGQLHAKNAIFSPATPSQAAVHAEGEYGGGLVVHSNNGTFGGIYENSGMIYLGCGNPTNLGLGNVRLDNAGHFTVGAHGWQPGGGTWGDSASDARVKDVIRDYAGGLDEILGLDPVVFTFKGNDTLPDDPVSPHQRLAEEKKEFVGLIAQAAETVMPEMVVKRAGIINGQPVDDFRMLDTSSLIYALVNAVKQLAARVEELEAEAGR